MPRFVTNVALAIDGDRIEKGVEIELSAEEAARLDPADISPVEANASEPEAAPAAAKDVADMSAAELKDRAAELGLPTGGSKADLMERISLHLSGTDGA